jgi:type II secretory pathway pseudopilin PulG
MHPERASMAPNTKTGRQEAGFTLAAVMIIMSVMMIFVAYTVPKQWSVLMQRDREQQTIFIMKQYAKACEDFRKKNNTFPVSMQQLVEARQPRFLRCPKDGCLDPLTGQVDWFVIPQSQAPAPGTGNAPPGVAPPPGLPPSGTTSTAPGAATPTVPTGIPIKDYAGGPFVGIKPNKTGQSFIILNGADHYEQWIYTALDYQQERAARQQAAVKVWQ